jgi:hypothetical protein
MGFWLESIWREFHPGSARPSKTQNARAMARAHLIIAAYHRSCVVEFSWSFGEGHSARASRVYFRRPTAFLKAYPHYESQVFLRPVWIKTLFAIYFDQLLLLSFGWRCQGAIIE